MVKVWPIGTSILNWPTFIKEVVNLTGHAPTFSLDNCKIKFSAHARAVVSLAEFYQGGVVTPSTVISQSDRPLGHLFFSFLIYAPAADLLNFTGLEILLSKTKKKNYRLAYVSGTLDKWKQVLSEDSELASLCLTFFNNIGLKQVFDIERKLLK